MKIIQIYSIGRECATFEVHIFMRDLKGLLENVQKKCYVQIVNKNSLDYFKYENLRSNQVDLFCWIYRSSPLEINPLCG